MRQAIPLLALLLAGCPWISKSEHEDRLDVDGDGVAWPDDCDEGDPDVHPGATERCNEVDDDCDGKTDEDDAVDARVFYRDADGDGHGVPTPTVTACVAPTGYAALADDCDDDHPTVYPGHAEDCGDHLDNDCDGTQNDCELRGTLDVTAVATGSGISSGSDGYGRAFAAGRLDATAGVDLAVGAPSAQSGGVATGGVHVFAGPLPTTLDAGSGDLLVGEAASDQAGTALAAVDVDHDGRDELIVGAYGVDPGGAVYVVDDPAEGALTQGLRGVDPTQYAQYGSAVAALGDVDGDGYGDFAVLATGSSYYAVPGSVRLFHGPVTDASPTGAVATLTDSACLPQALAAIPDATGDGVPDLLVASGSCDAVLTDAGMVRLASAGATGTIDLATDARTSFVPDVAGLAFGIEVDGGDTDGDGRADVLVGAPLYDADTDTNPDGIALVYADIPAGQVPVSAATARLVGAPASYFAITVAMADLNGDGLADVAVGAPFTNDGTDFTGAVYVWYGPVAGDHTFADADLVLLGPSGWLLGYPVSAADVDEDGYADLLLGAPGQTSSSRIYVVHGRGR